MLCEDLTGQLQWTAGLHFCLLLDAQGPPPLTRIVDMALSLSSGQQKAPASRAALERGVIPTQSLTCAPIKPMQKRETPAVQDAGATSPAPRTPYERHILANLAMHYPFDRRFGFLLAVGAFGWVFVALRACALAEAPFTVVPVELRDFGFGVTRGGFGAVFSWIT